MDQQEGTEQDVAVQKVFLHPKWNIEAKNTANGHKIVTTHDIALLQLSSPVKFNSHVASMCLDNGQNFQPGETKEDLFLTVGRFLGYFHEVTETSYHLMDYDG